MRLLFVLLLVAHGLLHGMGFVKSLHPAALPQLSGQFTKTAGLAWLLAGLLFVAAALLFLFKRAEWWMLALPAALLSQILILYHWRDARFGSIANILVLIGILLAYGHWQFNDLINKELKAFWPTTLPAASILTPEMIAPLPPVVQRWLERSKVIGQEIVYVARLKQRGEMKTKPEGKWIPFAAEQWNTVDEPGFIWRSAIRIGPGLSLSGRDKYVGGRGNMLIKALSLYSVADAIGPETDQGAMLRNLAEICWFPSAALRDYIRWEQLDSLSARATMTHGGVTASGIFRFTPDGDMLSFEAKRYYAGKQGATLEDWLVRTTAYRDFNGVRIPYKSEVSWKLSTGIFTWLKVEITELSYN